MHIDYYNLGKHASRLCCLWLCYLHSISVNYLSAVAPYPVAGYVHCKGYITLSRDPNGEGSFVAPGSFRYEKALNLVTTSAKLVKLPIVTTPGG
jgi:hypothetical protein